MFSRVWQGIWKFRREGLALGVMILLDRIGWLPRLTAVGQAAPAIPSRLGMLLLVATTLVLALVKLLSDAHAEAARSRPLVFDEAGD